MPSFPVMLKRTDESEPPATIYYIVASNGLFQVRKTPFYRVVTRTPGPIPGLLPEKERLRLRCPRLPTALLEQVLAFFAEVQRVHRGEAIVILFYDHSSKRFRVGVPPQSVPGYYGSDGRWQSLYKLEYGSVERPEGFLRLGTIHSHADLPAYSSAVDCEDERFEDGLHIVFGDLDRNEPSRSVTFAANGVRFPQDPASLLEPASIPDRPPRADWMERVKREERPSPLKAAWGWAWSSSSEQDGRSEDGERDRELQ